MTSRSLLFLIAICSACQGVGEDVISTEIVNRPAFFSEPDGVARLSKSPSIVVGRDESLPLFRVRGAVFFGSGIAIANGGANEVLVLDGNGALLRRHGGRGGGPGEYVHLAGLARRAEGLVTWDAYLRRITLLDSSSGYVAATTITDAIPTWTFPRILGAVGDVVFLQCDPLGFVGDGEVGPIEVRQEVEFLFIRVSDGEVIARISAPGEEEWAARSNEGDRLNGGLPIVFGRKPVAAVAGSRFFLADTDSLGFRTFDETGKESPLSLGGKGGAASATWEMVVRDSLRQHAEDSTERLLEFRLDLLEHLPARETLPAFSEILGGSDGRLWVREYPSPDQPEVLWVAFDERNEVTQRVRVPMGLQVLDFASDRVLVLHRAEYGEEIVSVFSIEG